VSISLPNYVGNDGLKIHLEVREDLAVLSVVQEILTNSFRLYLGPEGGAFVWNCYQELMAELPGIDAVGLMELFRRRRQEFARLGLRERLAGYKGNSLLRTAVVAGLRHFQGVVVDVGANENLLGAVLLDQCPAVTRVVGVDIEDRGCRPEDERIAFALQHTASEIPLETGSADVAILRYSLHHMTFPTQELVLGDLRRVLRPAGTLIIVEDSFSRSLTPLVRSRPLLRFMELDDRRRLQLVLACLDACFGFIQEEVMPFAFSFRSAEEWKEVLARGGFRVEECTFWGLPNFSLFSAPMLVLVAEAR
jgi:ubiquinone/menaquinone biosynthesis C-methylase UbiE